MEQAPNNHKFESAPEIQIPFDFARAAELEAEEQKERERIAAQHGLDPKDLVFKNGYWYDKVGKYLRDKRHDNVPHDDGGTYKGPGSPMN